MLAIAVAAGLGIAAHEVKWYASYLANVYFVRRGAMDWPAMSLWSLAVEEQFYLLWPGVLLFFPRSLLKFLLAAAVVFSPVYRFWTGQHGLWGRPLLLPGCSDLFALGAMLAILSVEQSPRKTAFPRASLAIAVFLGLAARYVAPPFSPLGASLARSAMGFFSVWLIAGASRGFRGPGRWILGSRPIVYLGRISYGIYLYHTFVAAAADRFLERRGLSPLSPQLRPILLSALTVACAAVSWHFLEAPIARWKDRIGPRKTAPAG
jgi:peptidoglycan/LPS O-acetylase OafA/YrhL